MATYTLIQIKRTNSAMSSLVTVKPAFGELVYVNSSPKTLVVGDGTNNMSTLPKLNLVTLNGLNNPTTNGVLIGKGSTTAIATVASSTGAFHSTGSGAVPQFGTLPVSCGGTGKSSGNIPQVIFSASAPSSATTGDFYINTDTYKLYVYNGGAWHEVNATAVWG